jgi:2-C-methyl-D-erythritol 4-phosphate cytidylyltransferase
MVSAIVVAAGKGTRMQGSLRKQYLLLGHRPIVGHTLLAIRSCALIHKVILVVPAGDLDFCHQKIIAPLKLKGRVQLVAGGKERQNSVFNGLQFVDDKESLVVIHDGVRPFITADQLARCINEARHMGACILGMPAFETVKRADKSGTVAETLDRTSLWLAQTPQVFDYKIINEAHRLAKKQGFRASDDAVLVERLGYTVKIIRGTPRNIKITTREDLRLGEAIMRTRIA